MIRFSCPSCNKSFKIDDSNAGKTGKCPSCSTTFKIPAALEEASVQSAQLDFNRKSSEFPPPPPPPPSPSWYLRTADGKQYGPMTKAELDQWFAKGTISAACYIWQTGWPEWKSAGLVYQLSAGPTSGASASIPPPIAPSDIPDFFSDAASTAASRRNQKRAESPVSELLSGGAKLVGKEAKGFVKSFISIAVFLLVLSVGCPLVFKALNQVDSVNSAKVPLSTIGWREIDDIYNLKNHYTDLQKDEEWKKYGGKKVKWTGRVAEIHEGIFGLQLQVKMNADTFISDLIITLEDNQRSKGLKLKKEDTITFIGILDKWGTLLPITLSHGEIVDSQFESSALIGRLKAVGQIPTIAIRFRAAISRHDLYIRKWL